RSPLPVFPGKRVGKRVPPDWVCPVFVLVLLAFALLTAYPWPLLTAVTVIYLATLPFGFMAYRNYQEAAAAAAAQSGAAPQPGAGPADAAAKVAPAQPAPAREPPAADDPNRPARPT